MATRARWISAAVLVTAAAAPGPAADPLTRPEVAKIGKAGTALVVTKGRDANGVTFSAHGSAFCVHPSGLFVTSGHAAQGGVTLVLSPGLKDEKAYPAAVVRSDPGADLALLRIDGAKGLSALALGADDKVAELDDVVAVGFPSGAAFGPGANASPEASVNVGTVTALRRKDGALDRIQVDAALNPGNSGGPVLDRGGLVIGVVASGIRVGRVHSAVPVSTVARFLNAPDVHFELPAVEAAGAHKPILFEARVTPLVPDSVPLTAQLLLQPEGGKERTIRMEAADGRFRVTAAPVAPGPGGPSLRLLARFDNGTLNITTGDRDFKVGDRGVKFSDVRAVQFRPAPRVTLADGEVLAGAITGLGAVPAQLGSQSLPVDLSQALEVRFAPALEADLVWCTLVVRRGDKEVLRRGGSLRVQAPLTAETSGITPPPLDADTTVRELAAPVADVAVGGAGRYLVLHLPKLRKLAVFDVCAAEVVGHIPADDDGVKFAAGQDDVVVVLPRTGAIERWSLKSLTRDVATSLPIKGSILSIAMGASSKGPLLVQFDPGRAAERDPLSLALIDPVSMRVDQRKIRRVDIFGSMSSPHIRAEAYGRAFTMWHSNGNTAQVLDTVELEIRSLSTSPTYVLPGPLGRRMFTRFGRITGDHMADQAASEELAVVPSTHGTSYLRLNDHINKGNASIHEPGQAAPLHTFKGLRLPDPYEPNLKGDFTFDKRVHYIPDARVVVTIPVSNDRLVLHRISK